MSTKTDKNGEHVKKYTGMYMGGKNILASEEPEFMMSKKKKGCCLGVR